MPITEDIDYYEGNEDNFGHYQYIKLDDIISNFIMSRAADDYTQSATRFQILYQARRGMRELYYDVVREIRAVELELSPSLMVILPQDFVNYVRISWVGLDGHLRPMAMDDSMNIAEAYLQDHKFNLLYDDEGCVLKGTGVRESNIGEAALEARQNKVCHNYSFAPEFTPNVNLSKHFPNGKYKLDRARGVIEFGVDAYSKNIVLEYISDGLYTGCEGRPEGEIRIHKFVEEALLNFIYYHLIKQNRNVPDYEKRRARKEYYNSRRIAKKRVNTIRVEELLQIFKGESKWIKGE